MKRYASIVILSILMVICWDAGASGEVPRPIADIFSKSEKIEKRVFTKGKKFIFYTGETEGKLDRCAFVLEEEGKHGPIIAIVAISPEGVIEDIVIHRHEEVKGKGIKRRRFLRQFIGKTSQDPFTVGKDVDAITGATISSKAVIRIARKALELWQTIEKERLE